MKPLSMTVALIALTLTVPASASALPIDPADQAALDAARAKWDEVGFINYSYKVSRTCFCPVEYTRWRNIQVEGGKPVKKRRNKAYREVNTVPKLFKQAQAALDDDSFSVAYDPTYGFPRRISSNPSFMIADEEVSYAVKKFGFPSD
ncbi:MAG: hypothetical protein QOG62_1284 [Thermoleophilaceae bacterium]|jgi:hypothetical protein|nr:hypothetical protein [Thermoleophilaceae bacterium]